MGKWPRHIILGVVILIQVCLTLVSTLGGLSSVLILDPSVENIGVKDFDVSFGPGTNNFNFTFILNNTGVYDFHELDMEFNFTASNVTGDYTILQGEHSISEIAAGELYDELIEFTDSDFSIPTNFDYAHYDDYDYTLNMSINFLYSFDLIEFTIRINFDESDFGAFGGP